MGFGLLLLRAVLGLLFIGHGTQKLFGWFDGHGLDGTGGFFERLGYRPGRVHAAIAGSAEAFGGLLLVLGLLTPLGAAALIGVMVNAIVSLHWQNGIWNEDAGIEYPLVAATAAACLGFTGAGPISLDNAVGADLGGVAAGSAAVVIGVLAGSLMLAVRQVDEYEYDYEYELDYDDEVLDEDLAAPMEDDEELVRGGAEITRSTPSGAGVRQPPG